MTDTAKKGIVSKLISSASDECLEFDMIMPPSKFGWRTIITAVVIATVLTGLITWWSTSYAPTHQVINSPLDGLLVPIANFYATNDLGYRLLGSVIVGAVVAVGFWIVRIVKSKRAARRAKSA